MIYGSVLTPVPVRSSSSGSVDVEAEAEAEGLLEETVEGETEAEGEVRGDDEVEGLVEVVFWHPVKDAHKSKRLRLIKDFCSFMKFTPVETYYFRTIDIPRYSVLYYKNHP
jgi:hypothetical protein